jgi:hypothetical protein
VRPVRADRAPISAVRRPQAHASSRSGAELGERLGDDFVGLDCFTGDSQFPVRSGAEGASVMSIHGWEPQWGPQRCPWHLCPRYDLSRTIMKMIAIRRSENGSIVWSPYNRAPRGVGLREDRTWCFERLPVCQKATAWVPSSLQATQCLMPCCGPGLLSATS